MAKKKKQAKGLSQQPKNTPAAPPSRLAMHRPLYERILFALALMGVLVTVHLNVWYSGSAPSDDPVCGVGFDCQAVLATDPMPLGIPSAVWGLLFYLGIAGACAGIVYFEGARRLLLKKIRAGMIGVGLLYSLFLTLYQFFVLSDRCLLCLISATIVTVMAIVLGLYVFKPAQQTPSGQATPVLSGEYKLYGILAVLLIVLAGADYGYFNSQEPSSSAALVDGTPVAEDRPVDVSLCRYDPERPYYSNINQLVGDIDPIVGNPEAPVTIIEFLDPNCPHCKTLHPIMRAVAAKYPDQLRIVYKPVALVGSATHSLDEVTALLLAEEQGKFEEMLELEFVNQTPSTGLSVDQLTGYAEDLGMEPRAFKEQLTEGKFNRQIRRTQQVFGDLGLRGVPAVILEGRVIHSRSRSVGCLSYFIDQELQAKGLLDEADASSEGAAASAEGATPEG